MSGPHTRSLIRYLAMPCRYWHMPASDGTAFVRHYHRQYAGPIQCRVLTQVVPGRYYGGGGGVCTGVPKTGPGSTSNTNTSVLFTCHAR
eukprot:2146258-Rhodomonas_salina.4